MIDATVHPKAPNNLAVASLVLGVASVVSMTGAMSGLIAPVASLLAIVFGAIADRRALKFGIGGRTQALFGVLLGILPVAIVLIGSMGFRPA
ncbi:MAG: hypothetical protein ABWX92_09885 [Mycetocola sp.]